VAPRPTCCLAANLVLRAEHAENGPCRERETGYIAPFLGRTTPMQDHAPRQATRLSLTGCSGTLTPATGPVLPEGAPHRYQRWAVWLSPVLSA